MQVCTSICASTLYHLSVQITPRVNERSIPVHIMSLSLWKLWCSSVFRSDINEDIGFRRCMGGVGTWNCSFQFDVVTIYVECCGDTVATEIMRLNNAWMWMAFQHKMGTHFGLRRMFLQSPVRSGIHWQIVRITRHDDGAQRQRAREDSRQFP